MSRFVPLLVLLLGCPGSSDGDTDTPDGLTASIEIGSPSDGATFAEGDAVPLEVTAHKGEHAVQITRATWTIGDWSGTGDSTEATGLRAGDYTVSVEAIVEGETLTASVDISVLDAGDTDTDTDTDTDPDYRYTGTLNADATVEAGGNEFSDSCSAPITLAITGNTLTGTGSCDVFSDFIDPLVFTFEGQVRGGNNVGDLILITTEGTEERTPYTGTGSPGTALEASFDNTIRNGDGTLHFSGTWTATPM